MTGKKIFSKNNCFEMRTQQMPIFWCEYLYELRHVYRIFVSEWVSSYKFILTFLGNATSVVIFAMDVTIILTKNI